MEDQTLQNYLCRYFQSNGAEILNQSANKIQVQLTEALDQELINRPFYWQYIKKTGAYGEPMTLTFWTDRDKEENEKGEHLHFGSPRLHQIFQSARQKGKWTLLYENSRKNQHPSPLFPWLVVNVKYSFVSHQRKDYIASYGLQLIHGQFVEHMMDRLRSKKLHAMIPDHSFPMASLIQVQSGLLRIKRKVEQALASHSEEWAHKAERRMQEELSILEAYFRSSSYSEEEYEREKQAIISRYHPHIQVDIVNSGLFYLSQSAL
ncbi:YqhG family protein [Salibacterium aidingense]|uniref:YqhG family protein n=1 Tax=Salibacterium aidingense TaxID=384933 RepID=UPI003BC3C0B5